MIYLIHPRVEDRPHPVACEDSDSSTSQEEPHVPFQVVLVGIGKEGGRTLQERLEPTSPLRPLLNCVALES